MFLFATPSASAPPPPAAGGGPVLDAIRQGARATGTSFDYLLRTAKRESALDPSAKAPNSTATGLFQFIEQTWLGLLKSEGERLGLADQARAVSLRPDGSFTVADPAARQQILELRKNPQLASVMAGALTRHNRDTLVGSIGREPTPGELYIAHVLGPRGARDLIATAVSEPTRPAAADFPDAAGSNRGIFYHRDGRARGAAEVYAVLASAQTGAEAGAAATTTAPPAPAPDLRPPGLYGIFQTGSRSGPLSDAVARIWRTNNVGSRASGPATPFFPRSHPLPAEEPPAAPAGGPTAAVAETPRPEAGFASATPGPAAAPLPPARPVFEGLGRGADPARPLNLKVFARARRS